MLHKRLVLLLCVSLSLCSAEINLPSDDSNYERMLHADRNLKIYVNVVSTDGGANALSIKAVYEGLVWLGIGVNPDGEMIGGEAIIGQPNAGISSVNPGKYILSKESSSGVVLMDSSSQTLINGSITQDINAGTTTLLYIKLMEEPNEHIINPTGQTTFIWAAGTNNNYPSYHGSGMGSFVLDLSTNSTSEIVIQPQKHHHDDGDEDHDHSNKNIMKIFAVHGIMAILAWALLTPLAVGAAFLRSYFSSAVWFKLHIYLNSIAFTLTLALFLLAVRTNEWEERFSEPHFITGWILMGLVTVQVLVGIFRPHVETATTNTTEKMEKSDSLWDSISRSWNAVRDGSIRAIWEVCHRLLGFSILGLAIWQMQSGLKLWKEHYERENYLTIYWSWIGLLFISMFLLKVWAFRRWSKNLSTYENVSIMNADVEVE